MAEGSQESCEPGTDCADEKQNSREISVDEKSGLKVVKWRKGGVGSAPKTELDDF